MTDPNTDISGLVELLIAPLVEFPDEVEVTSTETEDGLAAQLVHVMICASKLSLSTNERMGEDRKPR